MSQDDRPDMRRHQSARPQDVGNLASVVLSVVGNRQTVTGGGVRQFVLDHLVRAVLAPNVFDARGIADELNAHRVHPDAVIDLYIPCAARLLGVMWIEDDISFASVTVGAMRLQSVLEETFAAAEPKYISATGWVSTLIVVPEGEQHMLGAFVLSAQLRRIGCDVSHSFDESPRALAARIRSNHFDLVLLSCSSDLALGNIAKTVASIRKAVPDGPIIALGGAFQADAARAKKLTGVDIVTNAAKDALAFCDKGVKAPSYL